MSGDGWGGLGTDQAVDSSLELLELTLHEAALGEARAEEGSVDGDQDPRASLEGDGGEKETAPEEDLKDGYETHGGVIVFLDELANGVGGCVGLCGGLGGGGCSCGGGDTLRWLESGDQVCASVSCDVEDGVDAEGEHGEGVLRGEEPDESHSYIRKSERNKTSLRSGFGEVDLPKY